MLEYLMTDWVQPIAMIIIGGAIGGLFTAWQTKKAELNKNKQESQAATNLIKCIARIYLVDFYDRFVVNDERMSVERWEEIGKLYEAYKELGGNGAGDRLYEELRKKKPYIVNETTTERTVANAAY